MNSIKALLAESTRSNGKFLTTAEQSTLLLDALMPQSRIVAEDLTIRFRGLVYSMPFASPGDRLLVVPLAGNSIAIAYGDGLCADTSASADRSRNHHGRHRATSRPTHSGSSTSVGKTRHLHPMSFPAVHPAMPPVRLRRRMKDSVAAAAGLIFHPIPDQSYSPEPVPKTRYGTSGSGKRHP